MSLGNNVVCAKASFSIIVDECFQFQLRLARGINPCSPHTVALYCLGHEGHHLAGYQGKLGTFMKDLRHYDGPLVSIEFRDLWIHQGCFILGTTEYTRTRSGDGFP
jgi:hypothetical protein